MNIMNIWPTIELTPESKKEFSNLVDRIYENDVSGVKSILNAKKFSPDLIIDESVHHKGFHDSEAGTALMLAARIGDLPICKALLDAGYSVDAESGDNHLTPLHYAAEKGHLEVCRELLGRGASITRTDREGETPMSLAKTEEIGNLFKEHQEALSNAQPNCSLL